MRKFNSPKAYLLLAGIFVIGIANAQTDSTSLKVKIIGKLVDSVATRAAVPDAGTHVQKKSSTFFFPLIFPFDDEK